MRGERPPHPRPHHRRPAAGCRVARFHGHAHGRRGPRPSAPWQRLDKANAGKYLLVVTGSVPTEGERRVHHDRGPHGASDPRGGGEGCGGDYRGGRVRALGQRAGRAAEPDRRSGRPDIITNKPMRRHRRMPADRRRHHRDRRALSDVRPPARPWTPRAARCSRTAIASTISARAARTSTPGSSCDEFDDEGARKGWCLYKVGCKGPATFSPCPIFMWNTQHELARSAPATRASAAPSRTSGIR